MLEQFVAFPRINIEFAVDCIGIIKGAAEPDVVSDESAGRRTQCSESDCRTSPKRQFQKFLADDHGIFDAVLFRWLS